MSYLPHPFAVLMGAGLTLQVRMNATMRGALDPALIATDHQLLHRAGRARAAHRGVVLIMRR